jgi:hypothetical protein
MRLHCRPRPKTAIWMILVVGSSILFSLALACATPFAGLAAVTGTKMARRDALTLVTLAWLTNQAIGYFILNYPRTWDSFAWGAAIGIAAILATFIASESTRFTGTALKGTAVAFVCAFIVYEGTLYAATSILPSSEAAFSFPIVMRIFAINVVACVGLLVLHRLATAFGLLVPARPIAIGDHA